MHDVILRARAKAMSHGGEPRLGEQRRRGGRGRGESFCRGASRWSMIRFAEEKLRGADRPARGFGRGTAKRAVPYIERYIALKVFLRLLFYFAVLIDGIFCRADGDIVYALLLPPTTTTTLPDIRRTAAELRRTDVSLRFSLRIFSP